MSGSSARTLPRFVLGLIAAGLLFAGPVVAQPAPGIVDSVGHALAEGPGGAAIGLLRDDRSSTHTYGAVDSTGTAPTAHTLFEIGSVTKTFTGLLLAERIEQGRLQPTTPVSELLPDSVEITRADSVGDAPMTLAHLATHRSGLPRLPTNLREGDFSRLDPYAAYGDSALYAFLDDYTLPRASGTQYEYSNLGMGLLGHLLAHRADTTYAALVRRRIADPLGLSDTRVDLMAEQEERLAQGYNRLGVPTPPWHFAALAGAGALRSTAADMLAYLRAHRRALRAALDTSSRLERAMRRALRPHAATDSDSTRIGLGWHETQHGGHRIVWHNGGTGGFRSFVGLDRATGRGVVVLVNTALPSATVDEAALRLLKHLRPD
ncbi:MAG: serine hydrolase domain-containing protein [Salinibacter sp.]